MAIILLTIGALVTGYQMTLTPVTLVIDEHKYHLRTQQDTVGALLTDIDLTLRPTDAITPSDLKTSLESVPVVQIERAYPIVISADGHDATFYTRAQSVEEVLRQARVSVGPHDEIEIKGDLSPTSRSAGHASAVLDGVSQYRYASAAPSPAHITIHRAIPFTLHENDQVTTLHTTASTVGEALHQAGLTLYLADEIQPNLGSRLSAGLNIHIDRSVPVAVQVDGRTLRTRTHRERVGEVLADLHIVLAGQDYTTPPLDKPLQEGAAVKVVRVSEEFLIKQSPISFDMVWQPDPDLEIDNQRLLQEGAHGIQEQRIRIRYENGQEMTRTLENEYVAVPPVTKVMGYGTKIVIRTINTPSGPVEYWRKLRMLATSYSAATSGTPRSKPWYGHTATGMKMRHGIVAVDPRVISLYSQVYVPGYGVGIAGDTGGAIDGRHIDLGYDDDNLILWYKWVDVYLLTPAPPADQINYILGS